MTTKQTFLQMLVANWYILLVVFCILNQEEKVMRCNICGNQGCRTCGSKKRTVLHMTKAIFMAFAKKLIKNLRHAIIQKINRDLTAVYGESYLKGR